MISTLEVESPALAGNLNGETARRRVLVYLPPSYDADGDRRFPVITLLHGYAGSLRAWLEPTAAWRIDEAMDDLIRVGAIGEMIVALPDARTRTGGAFYVDCPGEGGWETFIADDLNAALDRTFRTMGGPEGRAVAGHSVGGYGALRAALRRPDVFAAVYALSPALTAWGAELSLDATAWKDALRIQSFEDFDGSPATWWAQILRAACVAFSPDASAPPLHGRPPVLARDGRILPDPKASRLWDAALISGVVAARSEAARRLRAIGFDAGGADSLRHIPMGVDTLKQRFADSGVDATAEVYDGDHFSGLGGRVRTVMLPFLSRALGA